MKRIATDKPGSDSPQILQASATLYRVRTVNDEGRIHRTTYCATLAKAVRLYWYLLDGGYRVYVDALAVAPHPHDAMPMQWLRRRHIRTERGQA